MSPTWGGSTSRRRSTSSVSLGTRPPRRLALRRTERVQRIGPTAFALADSQHYPLLRQPPDDVAPSVMALLVRLITRGPCAFLLPLLDGVKRNVEQRRNLIGREALRLSTGLFARLRHIYRSDCGRWAVRIRARPHHRHRSMVWVRRSAIARSVSEGPGRPVAYLGHEGFRSIHNRFKQLADHHALRIGGLGQILDNFLQGTLVRRFDHCPLIGLSLLV